MEKPYYFLIIVKVDLKYELGLGIDINQYYRIKQRHFTGDKYLHYISPGWRIQVINATCPLFWIACENISFGFLNPNLFLGRLFSLSTT